MASPNYPLGTTAFTGDATLAASATYSFQTSAGVPNIVFASGDLLYYAYFFATFGTISTTAGVQINCYRMTDPTSTPTATNDTVPTKSFSLPAVASSTQRESIALDPGYWYFTATNLDATNAVTSVGGGYDRVTQ